MRIKVNDTVVVLSGKDKGKKGRVTTVLPKDEEIIVEGVNEVKKHVRRSQRNMQGGRLSKNMPLPVGKVMLVCPSCGKATRVGYRFNTVETSEAGKPAVQEQVKVRFCKKCKAELPKAPYDKKR